MNSDDGAQFVLSHTALISPRLVPEIGLRLAIDARGIFQAVYDRDPQSGWQPYWAFAWPGGQALARYVLDHAATVSGKSVLDIGAGSGIASIASAMAGAARVVAADPDPLAGTAIAINACANDVEVGLAIADALEAKPDVDIVLIGDLVYEPELAVRVTRFLEWARSSGVAVMVADRTTARRPPLPFLPLARYRALLTPCLEESNFEEAQVWMLDLADAVSRPRRRAAQ